MIEPIWTHFRRHIAALSILNAPLFTGLATERAYAVRATPCDRT